MPASLLPVPKAKFFDRSGNPLAGGKLYTYVAGSVNTPKATYKDYNKVATNTNPVILDAYGEADIWLDGNYKLELTDSVGVAQWPNAIDNVSSLTFANTSYTTTGVANSYILTPSPAITSYAGSSFTIIANFTNTGPATLNVNGLGAVDLKKNAIDALVAGDMVSGQIYYVAYDGTNFQVTNIGSSFSTITVSGLTTTNTLQVNGISTMKGQVLIQGNTGSPTTPVSATAYSLIQGADGVIARNYIDTYGAQSVFNARRSNGTQAAPTALILNDSITSLVGAGYGSTTYSTNRVAVNFVADGAWTDASHPTRMDLQTTSSGSTTLTTRFTVGSTGGLYATGLTDSGNGTINANDYYLQNTKVGAILQVQTVNTTSTSTGTTIIPYDNTIPQNTEGDQYMTLSITPKFTTSLLEIDVTIQLSCSVSSLQAAALFQDSTANALAVGIGGRDAGASGSITFKHIMTAGTTSATTFKIRAGMDRAGTTTFNPTGFGGVLSSRITIKEIRQ